MMQPLSLGTWFLDGDGERHESRSSLGANAVEAQLARLQALPELESLWLNGTMLRGLTCVGVVPALIGLDETQISDLSPLNDAPSLPSSCAPKMPRNRMKLN